MKKLILSSLVSALLIGCGQDATRTTEQSKATQVQAQSSNGWTYKSKGDHIVAIENIAANSLKLTVATPEYGATEDSWDVIQIPGEKPEKHKIPAKKSTYAEIRKLDIHRHDGQLITSYPIGENKSIRMNERGGLSKFGNNYYSNGKDNKLFFNNTDLGKAMKGKPAAASGNPNRLDVFIRGTDDKLWTRSSTDNGTTWGSWVDLGGILASDPTVISGGPNHLDVYVRGHDNQLWHRWWNGSTWAAWESLGGHLKSGPSAAARGYKVDVVVYGVEGDLWRRTWTGSSWTGWIHLGAGPNGAYTIFRPYIGHTRHNLLEVFAYGKSKSPSQSRWSSIYQKTFNIQ